MSSNKRKKIGELLVQSQYINELQLQEALAAKPPHIKTGDFLIEQGLVTEQQILESLELQLGIPYVQLSQIDIDPPVLKLIPLEQAERLMIMPIRKDNNRILVAMADPLDFFTIDEIRMITGLQVDYVLASKTELQLNIKKQYEVQESNEAALADISEYININEIDTLTNEDSAIIRLVNNIISNAVAQRASDIHFDPQENDMVVRYRIDGILFDDRKIPKSIQNIIITRIKIMGNLNITESRLPQDGRVKSTFHFKQIDIRLSTLPTIYGEKIVMRILDTSASPNDISRLHLSANNKSTFKKMIKRPNGIVLITGPTGSGKSSTLYAALKELNQTDVNIITIEDPVEYKLERVNQIQVNETIGMTFAAGLRSILRQDPDIIMLGEIRDKETAQIAVRASLTGHLVISTLHTNSAIESISRLVDMGVQPYLLTSAIIGIVSQRLVRKVCVDCSEDIEATLEEQLFLKQYGYDVKHVKQGSGCISCHKTGYKGRIAIQEIIPLTADLKSLILTGASSNDMATHVRNAGFHSLLQDGAAKVINGLTTVEELLKVAVEENI